MLASSHVSAVVLPAHVAAVPHLHTLLAASQVGAVVLPTQDAIVPHIQVPDWHVSPEFVHCEVAVPTVPHMHRLLAASQVSPVTSPLHVVRVPHRQIPNTQVSPATAQVTDAHRSIKRKRSIRNKRLSSIIFQFFLTKTSLQILEYLLHTYCCSSRSGRCGFIVSLVCNMLEERSMVA